MNLMFPKRSGGLRNATVLFLCAWALAPARLAAAPVTLLDVGGPDDYAQMINAGQALAVSFTTTQAFSNVTITAPDITSVGGNGTFFLQANSVGPGASVGDLIDAATFTATSPLDFKESVLPAGTYFVILELSAGSAVWSGSTNATITAAQGVQNDLDLIATSANVGFPPQSQFSAILGGGNLHYTITQAVTVPEPGTLVLMASGLLALLTAWSARRPARIPPERWNNQRL